jgi:hypothetical protein
MQFVAPDEIAIAEVGQDSLLRFQSEAAQPGLGEYYNITSTFFYFCAELI